MTAKSMVGNAILPVATVVWSRGNSDSVECEVALVFDATHTWDGWTHETALNGGLDGTFCTIAADSPLGEWYETQ